MKTLMIVVKKRVVAMIWTMRVTIALVNSDDGSSGESDDMDNESDSEV